MDGIISEHHMRPGIPLGSGNGWCNIHAWHPVVMACITAVAFSNNASAKQTPQSVDPNAMEASDPVWSWLHRSSAFETKDCPRSHVWLPGQQGANFSQVAPHLEHWEELRCPRCMQRGLDATPWALTSATCLKPTDLCGREGSGARRRARRVAPCFANGI